MSTRNALDVEDMVFDFLATWEEPFLSGEEVDYHVAEFLDKHFDRTKLGSAWGYTPQDALRNQMLQYMTDELGWEDKRIGE